MSLTLSPEEIRILCGGLTQPRRQLDRLRQAGFWRARLECGQVVLEREHYRAVCRGALPLTLGQGDTSRPQLRPIQKHA